MHNSPLRRLAILSAALVLLPALHLLVPAVENAISGNAFDQEPGTPGPQSFTLRFSTPEPVVHELPGIESTALALIDAGRPDLARAALTRWSREMAMHALDLGEADLDTAFDVGIPQPLLAGGAPPAGTPFLTSVNEAFTPG